MRVLLTVAVTLLTACATRRDAAPTDRPRVLTVPQLQTLLQQGEAIGVIIGQIDASGTVYRLTTEQREGLRADGMPVAVLSRMDETYDHAIRAHPDLAKSDERWIKMGKYWYGGLPAGWPRDWVSGAQTPGEPSR